MVVGSGGFPGASLLTQLFRQLTKPMSKGLVEYASQRPLFRRFFLLAPGRLYHRLEWSARLLSSPRSVARQIVEFKLPPIKEEDAIELGSRIMIEVVVFLLLMLLLIMDYVRSQIKSARKEKAIQDELDELEEKKRSLMEKIEKQLERQHELSTEILQLEMQGLGAEEKIALVDLAASTEPPSDGDRPRSR